MKYVYYGLLCIMFAGCDGCGYRSILSCYGCTQAQMIQINPGNIHDSNPFALLFSLNGADLNVSSPSPDGTSVNTYNPDYSMDFGFKYFLDRRNALRGGLSLSVYSDGKDSASKKSSTVAPYIGYEHHFLTEGQVSPYIGAGFSYSSWNITNPASTGGLAHGIPTVQATTSDVKDSYGRFTAQAMSGFDWYPMNAFAIGAEYSLGFATTSQTHTDAAGNKTTLPSPNSFGINGGGNIHLLVHF